MQVESSRNFYDISLIEKALEEESKRERERDPQQYCVCSAAATQRHEREVHAKLRQKLQQHFGDETCHSLRQYLAAGKIQFAHNATFFAESCQRRSF